MTFHYYALAFISSFTISRCSVSTLRIEKPCGKVPEGMKCVPGGYFTMGSNRQLRDQSPAHVVFVDTYFMDETEVTVENYEKCVADGKCDKQRTSYPGFSNPKQPKVGVGWTSADKYCRVMGKRLPTEAEWELAARGYDGDQFPWGTDPVDCDKAVIEIRKGKGCGIDGVVKDKGVTQNVKSRPPGRFGLYDIIGNADEYVNDWYTPYKKCGSYCTGIDPKGPCNGEFKCRGYKEKVVRGGSWFWGPEHNYGSYRRAHFTTNKKVYHHFGFRCAMDSNTPNDKYYMLFNFIYDLIARTALMK